MMKKNIITLFEKYAKKTGSYDNLKAMVFEKYGDPNVLKIAEVKKPEPKDNEILVNIKITTVGIGDIMARQGVTRNNFNMPIILFPMVKLMFGLRKPKKSIQILGSEFGGVIESVGKNVTTFSAGDRVFGYRADKMGCNAEYLVVSEKSLLTKMPDGMKYESIVPGVYGTLTAYLLLKDRVKTGQKILILGASGNIGGYGVQIAKHLGAEVTGVCSTSKLDYVKSLGADHVIDYTKEDFTKNSEKYDVVFDILGKYSYGKIKHSLNKNGRYLCASFSTRKVLQMILHKLIRKSKRIVCAMAMDKPTDIIQVKELLEKGQVIVIKDKEFSLEQLSIAHTHMENGHKKGALIITI